MKLEDFTLDASEEVFMELLETVNSVVLDVYKSLESEKTIYKKSSSQLKDLFDKPLPGKSQQMNQILSEINEHVIPNSTLTSSPYFTGYVMSCSNQAGFIGEVISSFLNQNVGKWHLGPAAAELEEVIIKWIKEFMNLPVNSAGILVSGGSAANLTGLTVARQKMSKVDLRENGLFSQSPMTLYASSEVHHCVIKSVELLGIGKKNMRLIPVNDSFQINLKELEKRIIRDKEAGFLPFCVVGSAGTVNTGAIDSLTGISEICKTHNLWFHVDGAYGGLAASTGMELFKGLEYADSIAVDPHKWLYVPFEAGCALFKNDPDVRNTFSHIPDYLSIDRNESNFRKDFMEYGFQLSRNFKALKIWMTFKAYGADKLEKAIGQDILKAKYLKGLVEKSVDFEVMAEGPLSVICYRANPRGLRLTEEYLEKLNKLLLEEIEKDGRMFLTGTKIRGKTVLRSCFVNHRTQKHHIDYMFEILQELMQKVIDSNYTLVRNN